MVKTDIITMAAKNLSAPQGPHIFDDAGCADWDNLHCGYGVAGARDAERRSRKCLSNGAASMKLK